MAVNISPVSIAPIPMVDEKNPTNIAAVDFGRFGICEPADDLIRRWADQFAFRHFF
jgi:hypothetical protein